MSLITLTSGGLDSTLMAYLIKQEGLTQHPLFIDYGQRNKDREYGACKRNFAKHGLPEPVVASLAGFGQLVPSGLTNMDKRVLEDAFLPCRNLLFLLTGAAFGYSKGATGVAIGLLSEEVALFPDQTKAFVDQTQDLLSRCLDRKISIVAPFIRLTKAQVYQEAMKHGITGTYSCHLGGDTPCGKCIACREYAFLEE
jgi:7-cyano-7-deazaguanine synthase